MCIRDVVLVIRHILLLVKKTLKETRSYVSLLLTAFCSGSILILCSHTLHTQNIVKV